MAASVPAGSARTRPSRRPDATRRGRARTRQGPGALVAAPGPWFVGRCVSRWCAWRARPSASARLAVRARVTRAVVVLLGAVAGGAASSWRPAFLAAALRRLDGVLERRPWRLSAASLDLDARPSRRPWWPWRRSSARPRSPRWRPRRRPRRSPRARPRGCPRRRPRRARRDGRPGGSRAGGAAPRRPRRRARPASRGGGRLGAGGLGQPATVLRSGLGADGRRRSCCAVVRAVPAASVARRGRRRRPRWPGCGPPWTARSAWTWASPGQGLGLGAELAERRRGRARRPGHRRRRRRGRAGLLGQRAAGHGELAVLLHGLGWWSCRLLRGAGCGGGCGRLRCGRAAAACSRT